MRLRTRILLAIVATLLVGVVLGTWLVQTRLQDGALREAASQSRARALQVQSLYAERGATLLAEAEATSLYPAVIGALVDNNPVPFRRWSAQVSNLQGTGVTVTDAQGTVVARGHTPDMTGDNLALQLDGLRHALSGERISQTEDGDELGLALRSYVPVRRDGIAGDVVGAVMIAQPLDARFLSRLGGSEPPALDVQVRPASERSTLECLVGAAGLSATCTVPVAGPAGETIAGLRFDAPLADLEQAQTEAQRGLWLASLTMLILGIGAAWLLARSLTQPLARLTAAAQRIAAGNFSEAVTASGNDEIGTLGRAFEQMRSRVASMTGTLRNERDVLDAVLESAGDGIIMVDERGETVVANDVWRYLAGGHGLEAARDLMRADSIADPETFGQAVARWLADPEHVVVADFERLEPFAHFRIYSAPVRHQGGTILGRIVVLRDVTRETEAERARSALMATVSHELRSPLTAISGYTDTLLHDGPWDADTEREFLEVVAVSASRLSALVDNLLDAATLDAGGLRLNREPVKLERVVERVLAQRRLLAGACTLHFETRPGLPLADADPIRVEQVLANLVDNAIKYSPRGGAIRVRITTDAQGMLCVSVSDQGQGIPSEHLERLFDRFYRVESGGRSIRGVGLGLYICRTLIESHGGRIWVDSQVGLGSTFSFTLPALSVAPEEPSPPREAAGAARGSR